MSKRIKNIAVRPGEARFYPEGNRLYPYKTQTKQLVERWRALGYNAKEYPIKLQLLLVQNNTKLVTIFPTDHPNAEIVQEKQFFINDKDIEKILCSRYGFDCKMTVDDVKLIFDLTTKRELEDDTPNLADVLNKKTNKNKQTSLPKIVLEGIITSIIHSYASKDAPALIGHDLNKPLPTKKDIKTMNFEWVKKVDPYDYSEIDIKTHGIELAIIRPAIPEVEWKIDGKENKIYPIKSGTKIRLTLEILK